jgi:phosphoglycerate-specific signal transduction histidine kinase
VLHEVTEALTALGNYLAVAHRKFEEQPEPRQEGLGEALEKSLGQQERASEAVRRLNNILRREAAHNDDPGGFR